MIWILIAIAIIVVVYFTLIKPFDYWSIRGVSQYNIRTIWKETLLSFIPHRPLTDSITMMYNDFPNKRYCGVYRFFTPLLFLRDPDLIKQITVKDFDHFTDHCQILPEDSEPLWEKNLFMLKGDKWRNMRSTLSPSFTGSKMKIMFGLMLECAKQFIEYFEEKNSEILTIEMKDTFTRFANDVIASAAFGLNCNSLKEPNNEFYLMGKEVTNFGGILTNIKLVLILIVPTLAKTLKLKLFKDNVTSFFSKIIKDNLESREKHGIIRPDMIHLLMEAKKGKKSEKAERFADGGDGGKLTDEDITAQAVAFFFAGFDSVSTLMCFMAHELAVNIDIQQRLQEEVDETLKDCNGILTYEAVTKMKYMDMVISETLRKWPSGVLVDRACTKPYTIEAVAPGEKPVCLNQGDSVCLPLFALHRDSKYYPEPERFDPERFSEENKSKIDPYMYIPFGAGPRSCMGNRFALMETKLLFLYILSKFDITVVEKTKIPLKLERSQFRLTAEGGFWLGLKRREI